MRLLLTLCLFCPAAAQAAVPQAPPIRPCPPQAPPVRPEPAKQTELRMVNGVIYEVTVDTPWADTTKGKVFQSVSPQTPFCPDGRCTLPNR